MNINFTGKTDVRSQALEDMCEKKLAKLNTRLDENTVIDVNFSMESGKPVISMQLNVDGAKFVAKVKGDDMYKNIDDCIAKIKTQLNKTKVSKKGSKKPDIAED